MDDYQEKVFETVIEVKLFSGCSTDEDGNKDFRDRRERVVISNDFAIGGDLIINFDCILNERYESFIYSHSDPI